MLRPVLLAQHVRLVHILVLPVPCQQIRYVHPVSQARVTVQPRMRLPVPLVLYVLRGHGEVVLVQQPQIQGVLLASLAPPSVQLQMLRPVQPVLPLVSRDQPISPLRVPSRRIGFVVPVLYVPLGHTGLRHVQR
jgi:hypothetical protein